MQHRQVNDSARIWSNHGRHVLQVLASPKQRQLLADSLPDDLPGQSNCGAADASSASFPEPAQAAAASALDPPSDWHQPEASSTCTSSSAPPGEKSLPWAHN